jgi:CubicO group peptidase (beta-lactamase class C family)
MRRSHFAAALVCFVCPTLLPGAAFAQAQADALDAVLEPIRAKHDAPALAGAIVDLDGETVLGAVGTRRAGHDEPVTTDDLWHLGSCTKAMTATLIARLVERGDLEWTTTLADAFPDLADQMDPGWRDVTIELLLANRGGATHNLDRDGLWGRLWNHKGTPVEARRLLLEGVTKHAPEYEPGTQNVYSNAGFAIAGHMAETITGTPWEDLIQREVFAPLGITTAGFGAPGEATKNGSADQPRGHRNGKPVEPGPGADNPPAISPAGRVHMSLEDSGRFVVAHLRGGAGEPVLCRDGTVFLSPESFAKLHTPADGSNDGYALGWGVAARPWARGTEPGDTGRVLTHNGSNTMWFCVTWVAPEKGFAVLVTTNTAGDDAEQMTDEAAWALIQHQLARAKN